jgi:hypothetical protein
MQKRRLRVVNWLNITPVIANCSLCSKSFKVPLTALSRATDAQAYLQQHLDAHQCIRTSASQPLADEK